MFKYKYKNYFKIAKTLLFVLKLIATAVIKSYTMIDTDM